MKDKKIFQKRDWLNPIGSYNQGMVASQMHLCDWSAKDDPPDIHLEAEFVLWDCSKKVVLDLDCSSKKRAKTVKKKLLLLAYHIESLLDGLERYEDQL